MSNPLFDPRASREHLQEMQEKALQAQSEAEAAELESHADEAAETQVSNAQDAGATASDAPTRKDREEDPQDQDAEQPPEDQEEEERIILTPSEFFSGAEEWILPDDQGKAVPCQARVIDRKMVLKDERSRQEIGIAPDQDSTTYLVQMPDGQTRQMTKEQLSAEHNRARAMAQEQGMQPTAGAMNSAGQVSWLGGLMAALARKIGKNSEGTEKADEALSEKAQDSYAQWERQQVLRDAQAAGRFRDAADRIYREMASDERIQSRMEEITALTRKVSEGRATPEDYQDLHMHGREIRRVIQQDPQMRQQYDRFIQNLDGMLERQGQVMDYAQRHEGLPDQVRMAVPGEGANQELLRKLSDLNGGDPEREKDRTKKLQEMAKRISDMIQELIQRLTGKDASNSSAPSAR